MQRNQAEEAGAGLVQIQVRPGQDGSDRGVRVLVGIEQIKSSLTVGEFADQVGEPVRGLGGGEFGRDPQR